MPKVLINYGHRKPQASRYNSELLAALKGLAAVTVNDLTHHYPNFRIDGERERELLLAHDVIVLQFPFYWYHTPAILKEWQDETLSQGFAYGQGGNKLRGKRLMIAMTTGGPAEAYSPGGQNRFTYEELLAPLHATANLTGMLWLAPFVSDGVFRQTPELSARYAAEYRHRIEALTAGGD